LECLESCELQMFINKKFICEWYGKDLESGRMEEGIVVYRCPECIEEGTKGLDQKTNTLEGIRKGLVYLGDHFYSFKDAFENDLADLYRNLKRLESEERKEDV
jgi:hypothetical protein